MTLTHINRFDAIQQEHIHAQWRDWRTYLQAHLELLDLRTTAPGMRDEDIEDVFELGVETPKTREAAARQRLAAIPRARTAVFDQERERARQQMQADRERDARLQAGDGPAHTVDPDDIDRQVLTTLLADAEGRTTDDGWGRVPMAVDDWFRVHVESLRDAPLAETYDLAPSDDLETRKRIMLAMGLLVAGVVFVIGWIVWPRGTGASMVAERPAAAANGTPISAWTPRQITLSGAGREATLPLVATTPQDWSTRDQETAGSAAWFAATLYPLSVCVPLEALELESLAEVARVRVSSADAAPDRVYTLRPTADGPVDLVLAACRGSERRYGLLSETPAIPIQPTGEPVLLWTDTTTDARVTLTVRAITVAGPGQDPTLPENQARVIVQVATTQPLDWPGLAPTLTLLTGAGGSSPEVQTTGATTTLRYLVPRFTAPLEATWHVRLPDTSVRRWRATLEPPPERAALLRQVLVVDDVAVQPSASPDLLAIRMTVQNRSAAPLVLVRDDLALIQANTRLPTPAMTAFDTPLAPGETRPVTLDVRADRGAPLELRLGPLRARIEGG